MPGIVISARTVSGLIGLVLCYSFSLYFFWNSQISFVDFRADPGNSHFTQLLHKLFGYGGNQGEPNKSIGTIVAFLSVHLSWAMRYYAGQKAERLWQKIKPGNSKTEPSYPQEYDISDKISEQQVLEQISDENSDHISATISSNPEPARLNKP